MGITDMIKGVSVVKDALEAGKEVKNPASWKNFQVTASHIVAITGLALFGLKQAGVEIPITDSQIAEFGGAIATILAIINSLITTVSTKKIGAEPK